MELAQTGKVGRNLMSTFRFDLVFDRHETLPGPPVCYVILNNSGPDADGSPMVTTKEYSRRGIVRAIDQLCDELQEIKRNAEGKYAAEARRP